MKLIKKFFYLFLFFPLLSGCSDKPVTIDDLTGIGDDLTELFGGDDSDNYGNSKSIAMLEIPPSLDNPNYTDALKVPKSIDADGEISDLSDAPVLPTYMDMKIIKQGVARWIEIDADPVSIWPYLSEFWKSQGYKLKINEPVNGILETDWKKNENNFGSGSNLLDSEEFNYSASREKFRVRVERQPNGYLNIYISNQLLEADDVIDNGKIIWKKKQSDFHREAEMLVRMLEYFGTNRDTAIKLLNESESEDKEIYIDLIDFGGIPAILIEDSFSKMWREIGLSLDRSGLFVIDQNRNKAFYIISSNIIDGKDTEYEIKLTKRNNKYLVTAHESNKKQKISNKSARKILKHIISAYNPKIANK